MHKWRQVDCALRPKTNVERLLASLSHVQFVIFALLPSGNYLVLVQLLLCFFLQTPLLSSQLKLLLPVTHTRNLRVCHLLCLLLKAHLVCIIQQFFFLAFLLALRLRLDFPVLKHIYSLCTYIHLVELVVLNRGFLLLEKVDPILVDFLGLLRTKASCLLQFLLTLKSFLLVGLRKNLV